MNETERVEEILNLQERMTYAEAQLFRLQTMIIVIMAVMIMLLIGVIVATLMDGTFLP